MFVSDGREALAVVAVDSEIQLSVGGRNRLGDIVNDQSDFTGVQYIGYRKITLSRVFQIVSCDVLQEISGWIKKEDRVGVPVREMHDIFVIPANQFGAFLLPMSLSNFAPRVLG